ncbi:MAG: hypothetical protein WKF79_10840 [Nocardioides sp.]
MSSTAPRDDLRHKRLPPVLRLRRIRALFTGVVLLIIAPVLLSSDLDLRWAVPASVVSAVLAVPCLWPRPMPIEWDLLADVLARTRRSTYAAAALLPPFGVMMAYLPWSGKAWVWFWLAGVPVLLLCLVGSSGALVTAARSRRRADQLTTVLRQRPGEVDRFSLLRTRVRVPVLGRLVNHPELTLSGFDVVLKNGLAFELCGRPSENRNLLDFLRTQCPQAEVRELEGPFAPS